jgi:fibronectin type 3 domain-containing protein
MNHKASKFSMLMAIALVVQLLVPAASVFAAEDLEAPTNLTVREYEPANIVLMWDEVSGANKYRVYSLNDGNKELLRETGYLRAVFKELPEGIHTYAVSAINDSGESSLSTSVSIEIIYPEMQAPGDVKYFIQNGNDIIVRWNEVEHAEAYKLYQIIDGEQTLLATRENTAFALRDMPEGTYEFEVTSVNHLFGESQESSHLSFELTHPEMQAPGDFKHFIRDGNDIIVRWNEVEYATAYKLYQIVDGERTLLATKENTAHALRNMPEGNYAFEVTSYSDRFGESQQPSQLSLDLVHPEMQAPGDFKNFIRDGNDIILRWNEAEYATAYNVYQIIDGEKELIVTKDPDRTAHALRDMPEGTYEFEVTSVSDRFGESQESSQLSFELVHPEMQAPGDFKYIIRNGNDIILRWNEAEYVTAYNVYQIIDGEKELVVTKDPDRTAHALRDMPEGIYEFEVTSVSDRFGESDPASLEVVLVHPDMQNPENLTHNINNGNNVVLKWDEVEYATYYNVYQVEDGERVLLETTEDTFQRLLNMPEGEYTFLVTAKSDRFGESAGAEEQVVVEFPEIVAPELKLKNVKDNNAVLEWNEIKNISKYNVYEIVDGEALLIDSTDKTTFVVKNIEDGIHNYVVTAVSDRFGESENSNTVTVEIQSDITPPETTSNITDGWLNANFNVELTATDDKSGVDKTFYSVNGSEFTEGTSFTVTEEGVNEVSFYSVDKAGNVEEVQIVEVKIDKTAPETTSNVTDEWLNSDFTVELEATDNLSGVAQTFYSVNGSEFTEGISFTVTEEGVNEVSFYSVDKAGNVEEVQTVEVKIDKTAPKTNSNVTDEWLQDDFRVELEATDNLSGVAQTFYSVNGSEFAEGTNFDVTEEGFNEVAFYSTDNAGNVEEVQTVEVKIDKTVPEASWALTDEYVLGTELELSYEANDAVSGVAKEVLTVDGEEKNNGDTVIFNEPGEYQISLTVTDHAGWVTTLEKTILIYIPVEVEVFPKVMKENDGVFTVKVTLPEGFDSKEFDLSTITLNGVSAISGKKGDEQKAEKGHFRFNREDFEWNDGEVLVELRGKLGDHFIVGATTVKVITNEKKNK